MNNLSKYVKEGSCIYMYTLEGILETLKKPQAATLALVVLVASISSNSLAIYVKDSLYSIKNSELKTEYCAEVSNETHKPANIELSDYSTGVSLMGPTCIKISTEFNVADTIEFNDFEIVDIIVPVDIRGANSNSVFIGGTLQGEITCETLGAQSTGILEDLNEDDILVDDEISEIVEITEELEEVEPVETMNTLVNVSESEIEMMTYIVEAEAHGGSYEHKVMVASVIINRVLDGYWGDTVTDVIYAPSQFSSLYNVKKHSKKPTEDTINAVNTVLCMTSEELKEFSDDAMYFYNPRICGWKAMFENREFITEYGGNRFFQ